jgi:hypothetical protein
MIDSSIRLGAAPVDDRAYPGRGLAGWRRLRIREEGSLESGTAAQQP